MDEIIRCPRCRLVNPSTAQRCDCGYDFQTQTMQLPPPGVPVRVAGSGVLGFCAGFVGGLVGLVLALVIAKGWRTKRGAWVGFATRMAAAVLVIALVALAGH
jgi:hypothetical protein